MLISIFYLGLLSFPLSDQSSSSQDTPPSYTSYASQEFQSYSAGSWHYSRFTVIVRSPRLTFLLLTWGRTDNSPLQRSFPACSCYSSVSQREASSNEQKASTLGLNCASSFTSQCGSQEPSISSIRLHCLTTYQHLSWCLPHWRRSRACLSLARTYSVSTGYWESKKAPISYSFRTQRLYCLKNALSLVVLTGKSSRQSSFYRKDSKDAAPTSSDILRRYSVLSTLCRRRSPSNLSPESSTSRSRLCSSLSCRSLRLALTLRNQPSCCPLSIVRAYCSTSQHDCLSSVWSTTWSRSISLDLPLIQNRLYRCIRQTGSLLFRNSSLRMKYTTRTSRLIESFSRPLKNLQASLSASTTFSLSKPSSEILSAYSIRLEQLVTSIASQKTCLLLPQRVCFSRRWYTSSTCASSSWALPATYLRQVSSTWACIFPACSRVSMSLQNQKDCGQRIKAQKLILMREYSSDSDFSLAFTRLSGYFVSSINLASPWIRFEPARFSFSSRKQRRLIRVHPLIALSFRKERQNTADVVSFSLYQKADMSLQTFKLSSSLLRNQRLVGWVLLNARKRQQALLADKQAGERLRCEYFKSMLGSYAKSLSRLSQSLNDCQLWCAIFSSYRRAATLERTSGWHQPACSKLKTFYMWLQSWLRFPSCLSRVRPQSQAFFMAASQRWTTLSRVQFLIPGPSPETSLENYSSPSFFIMSLVLLPFYSIVRSCPYSPRLRRTATRCAVISRPIRFQSKLTLRSWSQARSTNPFKSFTSFILECLLTIDLATSRALHFSLILIVIDQRLRLFCAMGSGSFLVASLSPLYCCLSFELFLFFYFYLLGYIEIQLLLAFYLLCLSWLGFDCRSRLGFS